MALEREMEIYGSELPRLLTDEGKFVLIHGSEVLGIFEDESDAVEAGYRRIGFATPFLIKQIREKEPVYVVPSVFPCRR